MKIEYIRNLNGSYMILKDAEYPHESWELLMLLNNKVPGLLPLQLVMSDGRMEYWYDITGTTSFCTLLDVMPVSGAKLRGLIENIFDMNRQLEDYMLDGENIQYLPELICFDRATEKYLFCYIPGSKWTERNSLQNLTEHLLTKIDHKDADAVSMGYALYEKSIQECCSLQELLSCIVPAKQEAVLEKQEVEEAPMMSVETSNIPEVSVHKQQKEEGERKGLFGGRLSKRRERFGGKLSVDYAKQLLDMQVEGIVAEPTIGDSPTMLLNLGRQVEIGKLIYQGDGREENFLLEEDLFLIGKDPDMVEGVIKSDAVSRIHAKIYRQGGDYYIEDLNSTNGTYVNGKEIFYRKPEKLEKQDRICFATEEYLFS